MQILINFFNVKWLLKILWQIKAYSNTLEEIKNIHKHPLIKKIK